MILAGDVGATKTHLALYKSEGGQLVQVALRTFESQRHPSLAAVVRAFLAQERVIIQGACFGVAGPVVGGESSITNLSWALNERGLERDCGIAKVKLLNDLEATANAVPILQPKDLFVLNQGIRQEGGNMAVIAPGTGLGEAILFWDGERYRPSASEGGHTDFGPANEMQIRLLEYLRERKGFDHVSYERVASGLGLMNIYNFLKDSGYAEEPQWLAERLAASKDPNAVISRAALAKECELCVMTLHIMVEILGAEAGNLALKALATGGVYVGGGIPPKILDKLSDGTFMNAFVNKGRFKPFMPRIPVYVILNEQAALLGAARWASEM
ncbi:MAG: glucokinase [Chloroflexi bacterium]|nr:glucokinase [Chloroflexota bacterium]